MDFPTGVYYNTIMEIGKLIIYSGIILILAGLLITYRDAIPWIKSIGHLPGDIVIKKENFTFYFPIVTSLIISLILTIVMFLFRRLR